MTINCDPQEIAKFAALSAHWWDPNGELKTLHQINPLRLNYITSKLNLPNQSVLDIGCGGGILTESMATLGAKVTGIDMNKAAIDIANLHQLETGTHVEYLHTTAESLATTRPQAYDVITCLELLEHVPDPASVIKAASQLVKPNGHLFFSTINRNPKAYLFAILGAEYILQLLPKNTHDYAKFIRPSELQRFANAAHLEAREVKGISYHPFSKQFTLTDDISVNYLFYATKQS